MTYDRLSPESPIDDNIDRLAKVFPSVVREGKVDFDALRQLLGDDIGEPHELYGLNWKGKAQARRAALTPSLGTLRPCPEESVDWDNTKNLYIEGDNLEVLKLLRKSYSGKVKMIYIDPPYNTGNEFVYPDDYVNNLDNYIKITHQSGQFKKNQESNGRFHTDWLNMMYP
ncbi:MAG: site-specific DNA-methyltransferase, partial [Akkermansia sp.]